MTRTLSIPVTQLRAPTDGVAMGIKWNPDSDRVPAQMVANIAAVVEEISRDYPGKPVDEIRPALAARWAAANDGASITEPDLTNVATLISQGKRVGLEPDGKIMTDDLEHRTRPGATKWRPHVTSAI